MFLVCDIYQMKVFVSVGVDVGLGADGEVEVDDRKLTGPFFHPVNILGDSTCIPLKAYSLYWFGSKSG